MKRTLSLLGPAALLLMPALVQAQEVVYDAFLLAEGRIPVAESLGEPLPTGQFEIQIGDEGGCSVRSNGRELLVSLEDACPALWQQKSIRALDISMEVPGTAEGEEEPEPEFLEFSLLPRELTPLDGPATLEANGGVVDASGLLGGPGEMVVYAGGGWQILKSNGSGQITLPSEVSQLLSEGPLAGYTYRSGAKSGYFRWTLVEGEGGPAVGNGGGSGGAVEVLDSGDRTRGFCVDARRTHKNKFVLCVDATEPNPQFQLPGGTNILKPNTSLVVAVRYKTDHDIQISATGTKGLFIPGTAVGDPGTRGAGTEARYESRQQIFAPRAPGELDVTVGISFEGQEVAQALVELLVDSTFNSAVRVGVAGVFLDAVDRRFEARQQPGAGQSEIVSITTGDYDLELVAGFAPFLEKNGRSYTTGGAANFAPYFGIGVLSVSPDGAEVDFLKSLHLGVEWAPNQNFSIAATGVLRRVTRLAPGFQVGGPVNGDVPTISTQAFGAAIVLNFSPELLNFAGSGLGSNF